MRALEIFEAPNRNIIFIGLERTKDDVKITKLSVWRDSRCLSVGCLQRNRASKGQPTLERLPS